MTGSALDPTAAAALLVRGGVLAYPTEGVWGLGCDPRNEAALMRLLAIKRREVDKGVILVASQSAQLDAWVDWAALSADRREAVQASWPGPNTWVMPARADVPRWITGVHADIAVRVSAHPVVRALCDAFGGALVSTSANTAGAPAPAHREALEPAVVAGVDGISAGETGGRIQPSTIRDARSGHVLRG